MGLGYESICEETTGRPCYECFAVACNRLDALARNLAWAATLCAAFARGWSSGYDAPDMNTPAPDWYPGCGRPAT